MKRDVASAETDHADSLEKTVEKEGRSVETVRREEHSETVLREGLSESVLKEGHSEATEEVEPDSETQERKVSTRRISTTSAMRAKAESTR